MSPNKNNPPLKGAASRLRPDYGRAASAARVRRKFKWWLAGFGSALVVLVLITLSLAGVVYSEMPDRVKLDTLYVPADVVVVLTGGRGRIRKALELFEQGHGRTLYISGTDRTVSMKDILKELRWVGPVDENRIILENVSTNTIQNAEQVARYVEAHGFERVLLVTSPYHVRRAHFIFKKLLPRDVHLDVSWFDREPFALEDWWKQWNGIWVTTSEFFKFFYAYVVLSPTTVR